MIKENGSIRPILKEKGFDEFNYYHLGDFGKFTHKGVYFEENESFYGLYFFGKSSDKVVEREIKKYEDRIKLEKQKRTELPYYLSLFADYTEYVNWNPLSQKLTDFLMEFEERYPYEDVDEFLASGYKNYKKYVEEMNEREEPILFALRNDNGITEELVDELIEILNKQKEKGRDVDVVCCSKVKRDLNDKTPYTYTQEEIKILGKLNDWCFINTNEYLHFSESTYVPSKKVSWDYWDVLYANEEIDNICEFIRRKKLSPFEAVLYAYDYVTNFEFKEDEILPYESRTLPGIMMTKNIVCVGYAHLFKAIIDKLGYPELKVNLKGCELEYEENHTEFHVNNTVEIKDEKYGIKGNYMVDACSDSIRKGKKFGYAHCLFPVNDLTKFKDNVKYKNLYYDSMISLDTVVYFSSTQDFKLENNPASPIPYKTFYEGIKNLNSICYGMDEKKSKNEAYRAILKSRRRAKRYFDKDASNIFVSVKRGEIAKLDNAHRNECLK